MTYISARKQPGIRPEILEIDGHEFAFVTRQRDDQSAVYRSANAYLRIGNPGRIERDIAQHKVMEDAGFPVAKMISEGEHDGELYMVESSLGEKHFGGLFADDVEHTGNIKNATFEQFVSLAEKFAQAQLGTRESAGNYDAFAAGIFLNQLCQELPEYAEKLRARFDTAMEHFAVLPFVITHGDFNPNNLYPRGVIDLEDCFTGPYGYDLVSAIAHIDSFPNSGEYEYSAKYRFTSAQAKVYLERMNAISSNAGLPPLSDFFEDFAFCRAVWLAAEIPSTPKLQKFRFDYVVQQFLSSD